jgi:hypothetical protein
MPERPKGPGCKPGGRRPFGGSNPPPSTIWLLPFASPQQNRFEGVLVARSPSEVFFAWRLMVGGAGIEPATFGL